MFRAFMLMILGKGRLAICSSLQRLIGGLRTIASATRARVTSGSSRVAGEAGMSTSILSFATTAVGGLCFSLGVGASILIGLRTTGGSSATGGLLGDWLSPETPASARRWRTNGSDCGPRSIWSGEDCSVAV